MLQCTRQQSRPSGGLIFALSLVPTSETADAGRWVGDSGKWHKRPADAAMQRAAFEHIDVIRLGCSFGGKGPYSGHWE